MINSIIESISISLNAEFGDDYTIYTESVEQGLSKPCFFIFCINPTNQLFLGKRYFREHGFCLQYFPVDNDQANREGNAVAERLYSCLESISVSGKRLRGTNMKYEIVDGVLNFFVNYDFFVCKKTNPDFMEMLSENVATRKGN